MEGGKGLGSDDTARTLNQSIGPATLYMLRKYGGKKKKGCLYTFSQNKVWEGKESISDI